jgi:hypothetical protein
MDTEKARKPESQGEGARRPYQRPAVQWEEDFTPYAFSTCGKMPGQGGACVGSGKS